MTCPNESIFIFILNILETRTPESKDVYLALLKIRGIATAHVDIIGVTTRESSCTTYPSANTKADAKANQIPKQCLTGCLLVYCHIPRHTDGEVCRRAVGADHRVHCAKITIRRDDRIADLQRTRFNPFTVIGVEGVVGGGDDDLTVYGQGEDIVIVMRPHRRDGIFTDFTCFFIIRQNNVADFNVANGNFTVWPGNGCLWCKATILEMGRIIIGGIRIIGVTIRKLPYLI